MRTLLLFAAMLSIGFSSSAQLTIENTANCAVDVTLYSVFLNNCHDADMYVYTLQSGDVINVSPSTGEEFIEATVTANGCSSGSTTVEPDGCTRCRPWGNNGHVGSFQTFCGSCQQWIEVHYLNCSNQLLIM